MGEVFARIGYNKRQIGSPQQEYETDAARLIGATVARDLQKGKP
jgi:hypothetical protein